MPQEIKSKLQIISENLFFEGKTDDKAWLRASIKHYLETGNISGSLHEKISLAMDEYAAQFNKWFSVEKGELPENNEDKEVWGKGSTIPIVAHYNSKKYYQDTYGDPNYMEEGWYHSFGYHNESFGKYPLLITHWRNLPTPPSLDKTKLP